MLGYNLTITFTKHFLMESDEPLPVNANFWFMNINIFYINNDRKIS